MCNKPIANALDLVVVRHTSGAGATGRANVLRKSFILSTFACENRDLPDQKLPVLRSVTVTTPGSEKISNGVYAKTAEKPTISEVTIGFYDPSWV